MDTISYSTCRRSSTGARRILVAAALTALLSGCITLPQRERPALVNEPAAVQTREGRVPLPSGIDMARLAAIDERQGIRVYSDLVGIGEAADARVDLRFPSGAGRPVGTGKQLNERFVSMINATRRFEVFDDKARGIRDASEIVVEGMVVYAGQRFEQLLGQRKTVTTVRLAVRILDRETGAILPPAVPVIEGVYGAKAGEGKLLAPGESSNSAAVQDELRDDLDRALTDALRHAAAYLTLRMRPMGKVAAVDGSAVGLFGGEQHGLQPGDHLIVFRPRFSDDGKKRIMALATPVAVVRCDAVGTDSSQCALLRIAPGQKVNEDDYAVLSDESTRLRLDQ